MTEKEKKNRTELFKLLQEHPELPIIPMVDSEIVMDDFYSRWLGSWGTAYLDEYYKASEHIFFRDDNDIEEPLVETFGWDAYEKMSDDEAKKAYAALPWKKAIIVNIDLPD